MSEWLKTTIGCLLADYGGSVKTGPFGTALKASEYSAEGVPLISVREIGYGSLVVNHSTTRVPPEVTQRLPGYLLRAGDIVFGRKGAVDRAAIVKVHQEGWFLGSDGIRLRLPETCDSRFMAYQIQSIGLRNWLIQHATGTTMASLNQNVIERMPIVVPPVKEQQAIAHILGTLDDKIELNRRMNETLEAMARAIFKSWFVDFDPVRAKISGEPPESICRRLGLAPESLDLFPDRLQESELGEIPEGWTVKSLDNIANYLNGLALQKYPAGDGDWLPVIKIAQLRADHTAGADRASTGLSDEYVVKNGNVLFSWSGSLLVKIWCGGRGALNQHLFKVTSDLYPKWFYYMWTKEHLPMFREIAADKATTMGHIQRKHLSEAKALIPRSELLDEMTVIVQPLVEQSIQKNLESKMLEKVRDALIPKLLSGELPVPASGDA